MANIAITQLPTAQTLTGQESVPVVQNGVTVQTTTGAIANSPVLTQTFLTVGAQSTLANSRYIGVGAGLTTVDGGAAGQFSINLVNAPLSLVTSPTGFQVKTSLNVLTSRQFTVGNGLAITNGDGIAGNPLIAYSGLMSNLAAVSGTGLLAVAGTTATPITIVGITGQTTVLNGNGVGSPTIGLASNPVLPGAAGVVLPTGSNADRPVFPALGTLRYNSQSLTFEGYTSTGWGAIVAGVAVTLINTGTGLTGGPITSSGTIALADTAVTPGTYGSTTQVGQFVVNAQGQITSAVNIGITAAGIGAVTSVSGTANEITATGTTNVTVSLPTALTFTGKTVTDGTFNMAAATVGADTVTTNTASQALTNKTINNTIIGTTVPAAAAFTTATLTSGTVATAPTSGLDIANKNYVDSIASGLNYHQPVSYASTAALPSYTYNNGASGVGATITANANGALSFGGGSPTATQRVLVKNEAGGNAPYNGVYVVSSAGSPSAPFVLTRATDYDSSGTGTNEVDAGDYVLVISGTNASTAWVQQTTLPIVVGVTPLVFLQFNQPITYTAGTGLNLSPATTFNISTTGVTAGSYGTAGAVPVLSVNAQGQLTSVVDTIITIDASQVTAGTLPVIRGGTGLTGFVANGVMYASSTSALATSSALTFDGTNLNLGVNGATLYWTATGNNVAINTSSGTLGFYTGTSSYVLAQQINADGTTFWKVGGTEGMRLTSTGLGIGTSSPAYKLDVSGAARTSNAGNVNYILSDGSVQSSIQHNSNAFYFNANESSATNGSFIWRSSISFTERMRLDSSGNLGLGVTPSAWATYKALQVGQVGAFWANPSGADVYLSANYYFGSAADRYIGNGAATYYKQNAGTHAWGIAPSGTAGNAITFTQAMTLDASGRLGVGVTSPGAPIDIYNTTSQDIIALRYSTLNKVAGVYLDSASVYYGAGSFNYTNAFVAGHSANYVAFNTAGTERARIDASGNLSMAAAGAITSSRINPRTLTATSTATLTPDIQAQDQYNLTAQAVALTVAAPNGTPVDGNKLIIRILDNGTPQTISWNATYTVIGTALPTTTVASKMVYVGCIYNSTNLRWDVVAVNVQA